MEYNQPRFIRLRNGDDIISECIEISYNDTASLELINPLKVVYMNGNNPGTYHIGLVPWVVISISKSQSFTLDMCEILLDEDVSDDMSDHYWKSVEMIKNPPLEEQIEDSDYTEDQDEDIKRTFH